MEQIDERFSATVDATGLACPMPVLRARRKLDEIAEGELLLVIASDPASMHDMPAFCSMAGHTLLMARVEEGQYHYEIRKGKDAA
ncbi:sulfurtransferase TusA [Kordiimonas gwangyangensis]|uniref:sulfurtransferase TusA n=1 Tax=Kordiimonas gwangyangensis TaxID=288022 RepID=UPI0003A5260A|nr:sulfurtransferase TusA [Kordiimonas gwangyangensis]